MAYQRRAPAAQKETVEGVVEAVGRGGKGLKIGDTWYGAYKVEQTNGAAVGDEVGFECEVAEKGGQTFHNIKGTVEILSKGEAPAPRQQSSGGRPAPQQKSGGGFVPKVYPVPETHPDIAILRQNAATRAVELLVAQGIGPDADLPEIAEQAIALARQFELYYSGREG